MRYDTGCGIMSRQSLVVVGVSGKGVCMGVEDSQSCVKSSTCSFVRSVGLHSCVVRWILLLRGEASGSDI